jgi:hypothetical protein
MTKESEWVLEYFDNEIESIIEYSGDSHVYKNEVIFTRIGNITQENTSNTIEVNSSLLEIFRDYPVFLLSTEFSREREWLHSNVKNIVEYSSLEREGSIRLDITKPEIETTEDLKAFFSTIDANIRIYTKYGKKLSEFFALNQLPSLHIEFSRHLFESFLFHDTNDLLVL